MTLPTKNKINKSREVLKHMLIHGSIDSWEAITKFRATRLSSIIFNLKAKGYIIKTYKNDDKISVTYVLNQKKAERLYEKREAAKKVLRSS